MERETFESFRQIIYQTSGITLNDNKEALVSARVAKRMRMLQMSEPESYLRHLLDDSSGEEIIHLLDVISTNVTSFFREPQHFDLIATEMEKWLKKGQRRFRFWSAGCSSGEEPYTLGMTLKEVCSQYDTDIRILATDISTQILQKSQAGEYDSKKANDIPYKLREKYFSKEGRNGSAYIRVKDNLRKMILFKRLNLSVVPFPMSGPMDIILCRNVMIYFDNEVRKRLLQEFYRLLKPGGFLLVGHAESLTGMLSGFTVVKPTVYLKK